MLPSLFLIVGIIVPITDKGDKDKRGNREYQH